MKKAILSILLASAALLPGLTARAQKVSVSTNAVEWAALGTINGEAGLSLSRRLSLHAGVRYNPWTFRKGSPDDRMDDPLGESERQFEMRQQSYSLSLRWWPWYVYSGWWAYGRVQYQEYNRGGLLSRGAEEGDAFGGGVGLGYTRMLHRNWNIEFGAGLWAGGARYTSYRCTNCGSVTGGGKKFFILPDDVMVSIMYVF